MAHHVQLIVGPRRLLEQVAARFPTAVVADLRGIACVPVERDLAEAIARTVPSTAAPELDGEEAHVHLAAVYGLLVELSREGAIGYVETEYFGGLGAQSGVVLRDGQLLICEQTEGGGPINHVLAALGVRKGERQDEFEAAGLHEHRDHEKLLGRR
jgi:hypothetical protein